MDELTNAQARMEAARARINETSRGIITNLRENITNKNPETIQSYKQNEIAHDLAVNEMINARFHLDTIMARNNQP